MQDTDTQVVVAAYPGVSQTRDPMGVYIDPRIT